MTRLHSENNLYFAGTMKYVTLAVSALIIVAVLIPGKDLPDVSIGGYDKLIHIAMFFAWALAVRYDFSDKDRFRFYTFLIVGVLFSGLTEVLQILVEGRSFDVYDMLADCIGLILGLLLGKPLVGRIRQRMG